MTGFIVSVFLFRNRASSKEAFEGLELGEGKLSRPVLRGPGGRKAAWLLGNKEFAVSRENRITCPFVIGGDFVANVASRGSYWFVKLSSNGASGRVSAIK
jgi:hypothetical protein